MDAFLSLGRILGPLLGGWLYAKEAHPYAVLAGHFGSLSTLLSVYIPSTPKLRNKIAKTSLQDQRPDSQFMVFHHIMVMVAIGVQHAVCYIQADTVDAPRHRWDSAQYLDTG